MAAENNPVGRLYNILDKAYGLEPGVSLGQALASAAYNTVPDALQSDQIATALAMIHGLLFRSRKLILSTETINKAAYLLPIERLETAFSQLNPSGALGELVVKFSKQELGYLVPTSDFFSKISSVAEVNEESLKYILTELQDLEQFIIQSKLPKNLKSALITGLEWVRDSIIQYNISGSEGIREATDRLYGYLLRTGLLREIQEDDDLHNRVTSFSDKIENVLSIAASISQILSLPIALLALTKGG
jgi:hypothetical protein